MIQIFPKIFEPIVGRVFTLPNKYYFRQFSKEALPVVSQRLEAVRNKEPNLPNDFLTWLAGEALQQTDPVERTPQMVCGRLIAINFAAIHTSTFTITNALFNLYGSPNSKDYIAGIRDEVSRVLAEEDGKWTKAGLANMRRVDSTLRETLRITNFSVLGLGRVATMDITTDDGVHIPKDSFVTVPQGGVHADPANYEDPDTFDAFRFSRPWEQHQASNDSSSTTTKDTSTSDFLKFKNLSLVTTSEKFLPFGHGKHACPGRFFAANELKLLIAYMVMNYDIEPLAERPPNVYMGATELPPMKATLRIRRRASAS